MYESPIGKGGYMSSEEESHLSPDEKFISLVLRYQEGDLSAEELRGLNEDLRGNPERLAEFTRIHDTSRLAHETQTAIISLPPPNPNG